MMQIEVTDHWRETFPGAHVGVLLVGNVDNAKRATPLDDRKREVEAHLREAYAGLTRNQLLELPVLKAYSTFYKAFGNTYHVQLQLESVVHKAKTLPNVNPLVDANFVAELQTFVLTAGHDAGLLEGPLIVDASSGGETFIRMNGAEKTLKPGDMMMLDGRDVVCTVLYGQDRRTPISPATRRALYVAYAPAGVPLAAVERQLSAIRDNVGLFAPEAEVELLDVHAAGGTNRLRV